MGRRTCVVSLTGDSGYGMAGRWAWLADSVSWRRVVPQRGHTLQRHDPGLRNAGSDEGEELTHAPEAECSLSLLLTIGTPASTCSWTTSTLAQEVIFLLLILHGQPEQQEAHGEAAPAYPERQGGGQEHAPSPSGGNDYTRIQDSDSGDGGA